LYKPNLTGHAEVGENLFQGPAWMRRIAAKWVQVGFLLSAIAALSIDVLGAVRVLQNFF